MGFVLLFPLCSCCLKICIMKTLNNSVWEMEMCIFQTKMAAQGLDFPGARNQWPTWSPSCLLRWALDRASHILWSEEGVCPSLDSLTCDSNDLQVSTPARSHCRLRRFSTMICPNRSSMFTWEGKEEAGHCQKELLFFFFLKYAK